MMPHSAGLAPAAHARLGGMPETSLPATMGSRPDLCVAALRELGMTDQQIARYFRIDLRTVRELEATSNKVLARPCPQD